MAAKPGGRYSSVKGFTLTEVLVTLALTSIVVTISYSVLNYTQQFLHLQKAQNRFANEYMRFKTLMDREALKAKRITETGANSFMIERDSSFYDLEIHATAILLKSRQHCDTFHLEAKNIKREYEPVAQASWQNKLVRRLQFETAFKKQAFAFDLYKQYEPATKLALESDN